MKLENSGKWIGTILAACFCVIFFTTGLHASNGKLWIAVVGPMTGENAQFGEVMRKGAQLAVDEINAAGGIHGKTLMLKVEDDKMEPKEAAIVAEKLSSDKRILGVVGHFSSSTTLAAVPIYKRKKLVVATPSSTSPALTGSSPYFFRACVTDQVLGQLIAKYAAGALAPKKVAVMYSVSDGPIANKAEFIKASKALGIEVVADEAHSGNDKDFTAVLTRIASLKPDLVYLSTFYTPAALIAKQAREVGLRGAAYIGMDAIYATDLIDIAGETAEGFMAGGFFHPGTTEKKAAAFVKAYRDKWHSDPEGYGANSYDIAYMLAEALEKGGASRQAVHAYMDGIGSANPAFEGVTGATAFDKNHDCVKAAVIVKVEKGKWQYLATQNP